MICSKNPERVMKEICSVDQVKESSKGEPSYYLGNDYKKRIVKIGGILVVKTI